MGVVKKTELVQYDTQRKDGIIAITLAENDELIGVQQTDGNQEIILVTREGMAIRFNEQDVRPMGRTAQGVRGIDLKGDDVVVGMDIVREGSQLLVVTDMGHGKRTPVEDYKTQFRGGKGVITLRTTPKNGKLVGTKIVKEGEEIMIISKEGIIIRLRLTIYQ